MLLIVDNQKDLQIHMYMVYIRNKYHLYLPVVSLSCVQNGVLYSGDKSLMAFQAMCSVVEMTRGDSRTSCRNA